MSESARNRFGRGSTDSTRGIKVHNFDKDKPASTIGPFRILPPHGTKRDDERGWNAYHGVHYGYKGLDFNDKSKTKTRVFACIEKMNFRTKQIEVSCPECRLIEQKEQQLQDIKDEIKRQLQAQGILDRDHLDRQIKTISETREDSKALIGWLDEHNRDGKYYVLVIDKEYKLGLVKLAKKHIEAIRTEIDKLAKKGIDALNNWDQGAWIYLHRKGKGSDTNHTATYAEEEIPGVPGATRPQLAPISEEVLDSITKDLPDLGTPPLCSILGADQIALLTECSGDPEEVDAIFKMTERSPQQQQQQQPASQRPPAARPQMPPVHAAPPQVAAPAPVAAAPVPVAQPPAPIDPRIAMMTAAGLTPEQIAAILALQPAPAPAAPASAPVAAPVAAPAPVAQKPVPVAQPAASNPFDPDMPAEDFAKTFNLPPR